MTIDVDIELSEIYDSLDTWDKNELAEMLAKDGIFKNHSSSRIKMLVGRSSESFDETQLGINLFKIWNGYYRLTKEEESIIKSIANRL